MAKNRRDFRLKFLVHSVPVRYKTDSELEELEVIVSAEPSEYIYGYWSPKADRESIWLWEGLSDDSTEHFILLLHEILEAINDKFELDLMDSSLSAISEAYGNIMLQNPQLFIGLLRAVKSNHHREK